jgi:hypothetical protein
MMLSGMQWELIETGYDPKTGKSDPISFVLGVGKVIKGYSASDTSMNQS